LIITFKHLYQDFYVDGFQSFVLDDDEILQAFAENGDETLQVFIQSDDEIEGFCSVWWLDNFY